MELENRKGNHDYPGFLRGRDTPFLCPMAVLQYLIWLLKVYKLQLREYKLSARRNVLWNLREKLL
jgi:hypothetical protein